MFAKACTTTQVFSAESAFSALISEDVNIRLKQYITFIRITWTIKSNQVQRHLINFGIKLKKTL